jgi:NADH-quinone oxidoreductase subunit N
MAFLPIAPEVILLVGALLVILAAVVLERPRAEWTTIAGVALAAAAVMSVLQWRQLEAAESAGELFFSARGVSVISSPMIVMDPYSAFAGVVIFGVGLVGLLAASDLIARLGTRAAEFVTLLLLAVAGLHTMVASANLVLLFLGLETASIAFYVIAGFTRERITADEAAVKYFLLGSLASAIFVYGVALGFAATGSTSIYGSAGIRQFLQLNLVTEPGILLIAVALMIVGLGFKVSAAPFHQWAPDVYQGAPGGAVGLMAAGVKVAGFAALGRVLLGAFPSQIDDWAPAVAIVAGVSMIVGTLFAAVQTDVKRLLAYSGVAHSGYILTALVAGRAGVPGMWFYVATYAFMLIGAFAVCAAVTGSRRGGASFDSFAGLGERSSELAWTMTVLMLGLGGIPFTAGFAGKVTIFVAAADAGYLWLVVLGLLTTVVGLYFYLRVIATMFMRRPVLAEAPGTATAQPGPTTAGRVVLAFAVATTLLFGILPWPLLDIVRRALPL